MASAWHQSAGRDLAPPGRGAQGQPRPPPPSRRGASGGGLGGGVDRATGFFSAPMRPCALPRAGGDGRPLPAAAGGGACRGLEGRGCVGDARPGGLGWRPAALSRAATAALQGEACGRGPIGQVGAHQIRLPACQLLGSGLVHLPRPRAAHSSSPPPSALQSLLTHVVRLHPGVDPPTFLRTSSPPPPPSTPVVLPHFVLLVRYLRIMAFVAGTTAVPRVAQRQSVRSSVSVRPASMAAAVASSRRASFMGASVAQTSPASQV